MIDDVYLGLNAQISDPNTSETVKIAARLVKATFEGFTQALSKEDMSTPESYSDAVVAGARCVAVLSGILITVARTHAREDAREAIVPAVLDSIKNQLDYLAGDSFGLVVAELPDQEDARAVFGDRLAAEAQAAGIVIATDADLGRAGLVLLALAEERKVDLVALISKALTP